MNAPVRRVARTIGIINGLINVRLECGHARAFVNAPTEAPCYQCAAVDRALAQGQRVVPEHPAGVAVFNNDRDWRPLGWVEIQRDDEQALYESDFAAARAVASCSPVDRRLREIRLLDGAVLVRIEAARAAGLLSDRACARCAEEGGHRASCPLWRSESVAVRLRLAVTIGAPEGYDLDADPDRIVRDAVFERLREGLDRAEVYEAEWGALDLRELGIEQ